LENKKKIKVMTISDMPFAPSGVGTQTRYMIEALLGTGKFTFFSLGGAMKHNDYKPVKTEEFGDDWITVPVDGYGNQDLVRSIIRQEKPDILWFMTDPRFWGWLWEIENEIRPLVPMVYYHVWDNGPYPTYNKKFYESNDFIATISKVTDDVVKTVAPDVRSLYVPHAVNSDVFAKREKEELIDFVKNSFKEKYDENKFIFFWNNRNARRKQSGSLLFWFKAFLDKVGQNKACMIMHTDPKDVHGQDLQVIIEELGLVNGEVMFSREKVDSNLLANMYNMADCTINISDAEGFGLSTLESLSCETPILVNMTGGLQEQVTDGKNWFGVGLEPTSKGIIGSQDIPWIYEDRLSEEAVVQGMLKIYNMSKEEREEMGRKGRDHVMKNYNFEDFCSTWEKTLTTIHEEMGSWETRRGYKTWELKELK
jgi:glycosyltransferase involved in cell wall biosynthesis